MFTKRIIPCLDVTFDDGNRGMVVKGVEFVDLIQAGDPVELAKRYNEEGADELIFLDITASHEGRDTMIDVIKRTADEVFIPMTVGGGISSVQDVKTVLRSGADKVTMNTAAVKNPDLIRDASKMFGNQCIVTAIDCRRNFDLDKGKHLVELENGEMAWYEVVIYGGRKPTPIDAVWWAQEVERLGSGEIMLTSMNRDGTKDGYDIPITRKISSSIDIPVIASGGAGTCEHIYEGFTDGKADACLAASIFHFSEITIESLKRYLLEKGVPVRL